MTPEYLLDTHVVVRWLTEPRKLPKEHLRVIRAEIGRMRSLALSAMTLLEIATLLSQGRTRFKTEPGELLHQLEASPNFTILPITFEIAAETATLAHSLRDPADRAIVATARVHRLRLLTSDQRIISSKLIATIE